MYRAPVFLSQLEPRTGRSTTDAIKYALWPIAIMTVLHRVLIKAVNGYITDDFKPVYNASLAFLNHQDVYNSNFDSVDPHYLYPPSGTLLIAPLALVDPERSRWVFIIINAIAIIIAGYLLLKLFKLTLNSIAAPILLLGMFSSETVTNTLVFTNINGCVLLAEVLFLRFLLERRDLWAGVAMGLTIAVKPILAPLLLIALVRGQWKVFITAIGVPVALTAIAWPLSVDATDFFKHTLPYLFESRDYFNSAIVGNGEYYGLPTGLSWVLRVAFGVLVLISLWLLYRYYREDELFFVATSSGVLLTAMFLLGSLGQMYYSMMLFPLLMTVVLKNSVLRNWPAWLAIYGFMSYDSWLSTRFPGAGRLAEYMKTTLGWSLLLIVIFAVLGDRYLAARREGRLAKGIDPDNIDPDDIDPNTVPAAPTTEPQAERSSLTTS